MIKFVIELRAATIELPLRYRKMLAVIIDKIKKNNLLFSNLKVERIFFGLKFYLVYFLFTYWTCNGWFCALFNHVIKTIFANYNMWTFIKFDKIR